ncbi:MAG: glycosyltransferase family 2 protein [Acetobacteraceae bacterium]|nr:glycosyltransferase family 2 protein [Acetobacteraceae bacterium]
MNAVLPPARAPQGNLLGDAPPCPADESHAPKLSGIMPAMGRAEYLWSKVGQVLRQSFTDFEMRMFDQSASAEADEASAQLIAEHPDPRLRYIRLRARGLLNARNEGIALARGEIILFLDDDVILMSRDVFAAPVACYDDATAGGLAVERLIVPNARRTVGYVSWGGRMVGSPMGRRSRTLRSVRART